MVKLAKERKKKNKNKNTVSDWSRIFAGSQVSDPVNVSCSWACATANMYLCNQSEPEIW